MRHWLGATPRFGLDRTRSICGVPLHMTAGQCAPPHVKATRCPFNSELEGGSYWVPMRGPTQCWMLRSPGSRCLWFWDSRQLQGPGPGILRASPSKSKDGRWAEGASVAGYRGPSPSLHPLKAQHLRLCCPHQDGLRRGGFTEGSAGARGRR